MLQRRVPFLICKYYKEGYPLVPFFVTYTYKEHTYMYIKRTWAVPPFVHPSAWVPFFVALAVKRFHKIGLQRGVVTNLQQYMFILSYLCGFDYVTK